MTTEKLLWPEHLYKLPTVPSQDSAILFYNLPKKDQYWRKPRIPNDAEWNRMDQSKKFLFVERERERRANGVWFYNNGTPTYITGKHYDHLVYGTFDYKLKYLDTQRHDFYFRDLIYNDKKTYGGLVIKPRRYGYTDQEVTDITCVAIDNFDAYCGLMSDTRDKVYSTLYDKITNSYINRPKYVRPDVLMRNGLIPKKKMLFQSGKVSKADSANDISFNMAASMNSKIVPKALSVMGYDGDKLHKLTMDEIWKWTKVSPQACWAKQKKCLFSGGKIIGKAMLLSTMGDDESYEMAIREGIEMWHQSNPFERNKNGFTKTGLYRYFVPGWAALFDDELGYVDKYGKIDIGRATEYIMNERENFEEGSLEHTFEMRKYPLSIEEALGSALTQGIFDKKRINDRIEIINKLPKSEKPYVEGKLEEDNNNKVHFVPDSNEPWLFFNQPYINTSKGIDKSNRFLVVDNRHIAPRNPEGVYGYDPVRYMQSDTTSNSISKASIIGRYKFDYFRSGSDNVAGQRAGFYLHRPEDPEEAHYEVIKAAKYSGFLVMFERQVESFLRLCRQPDIQFTDFLLKGPDGKFGLWTDKNQKVLKDGIDRIQKRLKQPKHPDDIDWLKLEPFVEYLDQMANINPKYMTKFDALISDIMCEDGLLKINELQISDATQIYKQYNKIIDAINPKVKRR